MMFQRAALVVILFACSASFAVAQDPYKPQPSYGPAPGGAYPQNPAYQPGGGYQPDPSYQPDYAPGYNAPGNGYPPNSGYTTPADAGGGFQPEATPFAGPQGLDEPAGLDALSRLPGIDPQTGQLQLDGSASAPPSEGGGGGGEEVVHEVVIEETGYVSFFSTKYWDPWEGSVEFGLSGTSGNSDTLSIKAAGNAKYEDDFRKHKFSINYVNTQQNGVDTALNTIGDIRLEWKFPPGPWSLYVHELTEVDEFKNFDWRVAIDAGASYAFVKNDYTSLSASAGGSTSREFGGVDEEWVPELAFGVDWSWNVSKSSKIKIAVDYFPEIGDFENYRMNTKADWETVLNAEWGLSLKLGLFNRYDSTPNGAEPNDLNYSVTLLWNF